MHRRLGIILLSTACGDATDAGSPASTAPTTELDVAWSAFATCLIGSPLAEGERASDRLVEIDLSIFLSKDSERSAKEWPQRCSPYLSSVATVAPEIDARAVRDATRRFLTLGFSNTLASGPKAKTQLDELFEAARGAGLLHLSSPNVLAPPAPTKAPPKLVPFRARELSKVTRALVPDARFLLLGGDRASSCRPSDENTLSCRDVGEGWSDRVVLISRAEGATPELFFDKGGRAGASLFLGDGKPGPEELFGEGSWLFENGTLVDVEPGEKGDLMIKPPEGPVRIVGFERAKDVVGARMAGDALVTWERAGEGRLSISVSVVTASGVLAPVKLGELAGRTVEVRRRVGVDCDALFLTSETPGINNEGEPQVLGVSLRESSGAWGPIVRHELANASRLWASFSAEDRRALQCAPGRATFDSVGSGVDSVRCTVSGCSKASSGALPNAMQDRGLVLRLGEKVLVVAPWSASTPLTNVASVVSYRFGTLESLAPATSQLLAVGSAHGGSSASYGAAHGFVHGGRAYVFFGGRQPGGTYGVSFGEDGVPTPILP